MVRSNLKQRLRVLRRSIREKSSMLKSIPEKSLINEKLKKKFTLNEEIYTFLLQKKIELEITKASTVADSEIIEGAELPSRPIKPNPQLPISALILGFTISLYSIFGKNL